MHARLASSGPMLSGLFDEEAASNVQQGGNGTSRPTIPRPPSSRNGTGLCGLSNLGATCYMNALLQTLHYTPEFREALFSISEDQLGLGTSLERKIPVRLQELFARLLLLDQESVGVEQLVTSFGWNNNEELEQHDVQELNRILFDAIESSLVGTAREKLTSELFHGVSVQQVTCQVCNHVSEREEDFLDIQVALSGKSGLEESMVGMYVETELLEGSNRYQCNMCCCLVDAKRGCRLRKVPPILNFSLLRFLYDYDKGERFKDTSRFQFPMCLDMSPYIEGECQNSLYDLFSVVIHSGSTHSGHYTAYIRDVDDLGTWTDPGEEPVKLPSSSSSGQLLPSDPIEYSSPVELIVALLQQLGGHATMNSLSKKMQEKTGISWNKRFKRQFGQLSKFLKTHSDYFTIDESQNITLVQSSSSIASEGGVVSLTPTSDKQSTGTRDKVEEVGSSDKAAEEEEKMVHSELTVNSIKPTKSPAPGDSWYCFNDAQVTPIHPTEMKNIFQGKTSAYMLFYRQKSLHRPPEACSNRLYKVPQRLQDSMAAIQATLKADRLEYETAINTLVLTVHSSVHYTLANGALHNTMDGLTYSLEIDQRKTIAELMSDILKVVDYGGLTVDSMVLHIARDLPAGIHLYECVSDNNQATILSTGIAYNSHLFVWDGKQVCSESVKCGKPHEPLLLYIYYPSDNDDDDDEEGGEGQHCFVSGFGKSTTLMELRRVICSLLGCPASSVVLSILKHSGIVATLTHSKNGCSLDQLQLNDGDSLTAEKDVKKGHKMFAHAVADRQAQCVVFSVESRCQGPSEECSVVSIEAGKNEKLSEVKKQIISQLGLGAVEGGGRLRISDGTGLGPPLDENQSVASAGITVGCKVLLEPGRAQTNTEVFLVCLPYPQSTDATPVEVVVDKQCTIRQCCLAMIRRSGLQGEDWHLRRTNWCGEPAELLEDESFTVQQCRLKSGDLLLIAEGRLPPKGYIRLILYNYEEVAAPYSSSTGSLLSWLTGGIIGLFGSTNKQRTRRESGGGSPVSLSRACSTESVPLHEQDPVQYYPPVPGSLSLLGEVEISRDSTVDELKNMILTLPLLEEKQLPHSGMLRLRDLTNGRPGNIFKIPSQTLKRLKLVTGSSVCCTVLSNEEVLSSSSVVFYVKMRLSAERSYGNAIEVVYDTSHSSTATSLCSHVSQLLGVPQDRLVLAKHKLGHFDWIRIEDGSPGGQSGGRGGHRKGKGRKGKAADKGRPTQMNIKNAPVMLRDGDLVGVKDLQYDPSDSDDFTTVDDDRGRAILLAVQEDKRKRRKAKSTDLMALGGTRSSDRNKKQRKVETGIKIFVPDYTSKPPTDNT